MTMKSSLLIATGALACSFLLIGSSCSDVLPSFTTPGNLAVSVSGSVQSQVTVGRQSHESIGAQTTFSIAGLPAGTTVAWNQNPLVLGNPDLKTTNFTISADATAVAGDYDIVLSRTSQGRVPYTIDLVLTVQP